ncbi:MAG: arginine--tRNA ligase [Thermoplasmataceae archaeon]
MLLFEDFKSKLHKSLTSLLPGMNEKDLLLDNSGHGDFTLRLFRIVKDRKTTPEEIYGTLKEALQREYYIESIDLSGQYINFMVRTESMFLAIQESIERTGQYPDTFQDPERILVEHTSANPTGPLHVGRVRNPIIGDSLARLLKRYGYRVSTQYYINDSGKQVITLYDAYLRNGNKIATPESLLKGYQDIYRDMEKDTEIAKEVNKLVSEYESGNRSIIMKIREIASIMLHNIRESLLKLDINIEDYIWESDFLLGGDVERVMEDLSENLKDEDGAKYITMEDGTKVFLKRKDGTSLYFARDVAYHMFKALNFDRFIDVLGEDHKNHGEHLTYVLKNLMGLKQQIDFVYYGFISLDTGKMSTRKGNVVSAWDLIARTEEEALSIVREKRTDLPEEKLRTIAESVARSSIRFNIIRVNPSKAMVFRWSEALNFEGDSAPYIMYSHTRASSILAKTNKVDVSDLHFSNDAEKTLVHRLYLYPYVLEEAAKTLRPDTLSNYLLGLVKAFNDFYTQCPVLNSPTEDRNRRISLVKGFRTILDDACKIIGISNVDEM